MVHLIGLAVGMIAAIPLVVLLWLWKKEPRDRRRALLEILGAAVVSILVMSFAGALADLEEATLAMAIPVVIGGAFVAAAGNRMVGTPPPGKEARPGGKAKGGSMAKARSGATAKAKGGTKAKDGTKTKGGAKAKGGSKGKGSAKTQRKGGRR